MDSSDVLEYEVRRKVFATVKANPGVHARRLQRLVDIPMSTLVYHLRYLERHQVLAVREDKYYKRYYAQDALGRDGKRTMAVLQQEKLRGIVLHVLEGRDVGYADLKVAFPIPASTLSLYLKELVDAGVLARRRVGRETRYALQDEGQVVELLLRYREGLLDRMVDRVVALWKGRTGAASGPEIPAAPAVDAAPR